MAVYYADDFALPAVSSPDSNVLKKQFKLTPSVALAAYGGAAGFLIQDILALAPINGGSLITGVYIDVCSLDSGTTVTLDVGDNQILSGAVTGVVSGAQTTPATPNATFTLTLTASTASFTATNGLLMVGGVPITYASLSGSTFVSAECPIPNFTIPNGAIVQQAGNTAALFAAAVVGQNATGTLSIPPGVTVQGATVTGATRVAGAVPMLEPYQLNAAGSFGAGIYQPVFLLLRIHASPTGNPSYGATNVITGTVEWVQRGYAP